MDWDLGDWDSLGLLAPPGLTWSKLLRPKSYLASTVIICLLVISNVGTSLRRLNPITVQSQNAILLYPAEILKPPILGKGSIGTSMSNPILHADPIIPTGDKHLNMYNPFQLYQ